MEPGKPRRKRSYIMGSICVLFFGFFLVVFTLGRIDEHAFVARAIHVPGTVTDLIEGSYLRGSSKRRIGPRVTFKTLDGRLFRRVDWRAEAVYSVGESVTVLYDPRDPSNARIGPITDSWTSYAFAAGFFGLPMIFGIYLLVWGEPERKIRSKGQAGAEG